VRALYFYFYYTNIVVLIVRKILISFFDAPKALIGLSFLVTSYVCNAQFFSLSAAEKKWALFHPFAAMKVKKIQDECLKNYDQHELRQLLDSFPAGGKLDAFRHVYSMAAFSQKIKTKKIRKLGEAHEKGNYRQFKKHQLEEGEKPDSLSSVMDLKNNELGISIGCNNRSLDLRALGQKVISSINDGKALVFKRNSRGEYLDCENKPVDLKKYTASWAVPKCLVPSDQSYMP
jgi:hypothetical protein